MYTCYPREERKKQIASVLAIRGMESKPPATMRQIARAIGMSQSGSLMNILWDMVDDGLLIANPVPYRPGWVSWHFRLRSDKRVPVLDAVYEQEKVL